MRYFAYTDFQHKSSTIHTELCKKTRVPMGKLGQTFLRHGYYDSIEETKRRMRWFREFNVKLCKVCIGKG